MDTYFVTTHITLFIKNMSSCLIFCYFHRKSSRKHCFAWW